MTTINVKNLKSFEEIRNCLENEEVKDELSALVVPILERAGKIFQDEVYQHNPDDHEFREDFTHDVEKTMEKIKGIAPEFSRECDTFTKKCSLTMMRRDNKLIQQLQNEYVNLVHEHNYNLTVEGEVPEAILNRLVELTEVLELEPIKLDEIRGKFILPPENRLDLCAFAYNRSAARIEMFLEKKELEERVKILESSMQTPDLSPEKRQSNESELKVLNYQLTRELGDVDTEKLSLYLDKALRLAKILKISLNEEQLQGKEKLPFIGKDVKVDMSEAAQFGSEVKMEKKFFKRLVHLDALLQYYNLRYADCVQSAHLTADEVLFDNTHEKLVGQLDHLLLQFPHFKVAYVKKWSYPVVRSAFRELLAMNAAYGFLELSSKQKELKTPWLFSINSPMAADYMNTLVQRLNYNRQLREKTRDLNRAGDKETLEVYAQRNLDNSQFLSNEDFKELRDLHLYLHSTYFGTESRKDIFEEELSIVKESMPESELQKFEDQEDAGDYTKDRQQGLWVDFYKSNAHRIDFD